MKNYLLRYLASGSSICADSQFVQDEEIVTVAIIGAGAAGLAAWRELKSAGINAILLEARDRIGGRVLTDRSSSLPVELGAEFVHGEPPAFSSILRAARLEVVQSSGLSLLLGEEGLQPCPEYWKIIEKIDQQIDPTYEMAYDRFLERAQASPFEKRLSRSHVEGFNAASAELISASAIAIGDRATPLIARGKQSRIVSGYGSLIDWLAADVPHELIRLQTVVRKIQWQQGRTEIVADTPTGERVFLATQVLITLPLGVLKTSPDTRGAVRFIPPLTQKETTLENLEMWHVVKLIINFRERFWRKHGAFGFTVSFDENVPTWWTQDPTPSNFLTGWAAGPAAKKLNGLSYNEVLDRAIGSLSRTFDLKRDVRRGWKAYIKNLYDQSPAIREHLRANGSWYSIKFLKLLGANSTLESPSRSSKYDLYGFFLI
jgi:monoamine oxidase